MNLRSISASLVLLASLLCLAGCQEDSKDGVLSIDETVNLKPELSGAGGSVEIPFRATGDWTAVVREAASHAWVSLSDASGRSGSHTLVISASPNDGGERTAVVSLSCGHTGRIINLKQKAASSEDPEEKDYKVKGFPAVWDFYAMGYTNASKADAQATEYAAHWKTPEDQPYCYATHGNHDAYVTPRTKEGLFLKSGMTVTLNPSVQACGLMKDDYYEFVVPVKDFDGSRKISVYGATGGAGGANAFWIMEYSSDGETWYEAPGAVEATVGTSTARAHFWNTETTVSGSRTIYNGPADDSFHFYAFACPELGKIADGDLHIRLRALGLSGRFDGSAPEKGWTDIKSFHIYSYADRPDPLMKIIAHRGGYLENGCTECSRAALLRTIQQNCMGSECDIMWTKDDNVVVCHPDGDGKVNGLVPKDHTLAEIQQARKLANGETVPSLKEYLEIVSDTSINPYGTILWLDVKWVSADLTEKVVNASVRIADEMGACKYIAFLVKNKYDQYPTMAKDLKSKYGIEAAWNGQITAPSIYGSCGWAQVPYGDYVKSAYWPPTKYTDANVQISIYQTPSSKSSYSDFYKKAIPYYGDLKALFVNHPVDLAAHLVAAGQEL